MQSLLAETEGCQAGVKISHACSGTSVSPSSCTWMPEDVHEILPRSAGGSILEISNLLVVCRNCHNWIHANPKISKANGLLKGRYG